jgi:ATP-dependent helicase HrpA
MNAFRLGEIETFPFINPPAPAAIQGGYQLLQELGALNSERELTELGRDLARLPIDPTLGRMLLQAQHEHATRELLIIASGLSIQDPRERPLDQKDAAAAAHKRFADPRSDFVTLLNIWNAVHEQWETLRTQNQRRKFCKAHFLSYLRMREWQDLHAQLQDALEELGTLRINESNAAYEAIHRAILSGLPGHISTRLERNVYQAAGNRRLNIFPGSILFERPAPPSHSKKKQPQQSSASGAAKTCQPEWIVAGEIVETSHLFARTVAGIEAAWIIELAPHLCKTSYHNPHWSAAAGHVLAEERTMLYGLEVRSRKVAYGNIDPKQATEIFVRSALVEEDFYHEPAAGRERDPAELSASQLLMEAREQPAQKRRSYRFIQHNRQIRHKIETWQTRMRRHDLPDLDQALFEFYCSRIQNVSAIEELNRFLGEYPDHAVLCATEKDLIGDRELSFDEEAFPDRVRLGGQSVPLSYAYSPGEERDGITMKLDMQQAQDVSPAAAEWAVPGLREGLITEMLRTLPKSIRRQLMPLPPKVAQITSELQPGRNSLKHDLANFIRARYGVEVPLSAWPEEAVPQHLRPRIELIGHDQKPVGSGRDLGHLRQQLEKVTVQPATESGVWSQLTQRWERFGLSDWTFGDLPERVTAGEGAEQIEAWPGLKVEEGRVNLRLFRSRDAFRRASLAGIRRLVEVAIQKDLAWLQKVLRALVGMQSLLSGLCTVEELQAGAFMNLKAYILPSETFPALLEKHFQDAVQHARQCLPGLASKGMDRTRSVLQARQEILLRYPLPDASQTSRKVASLNEIKPGRPLARMPGWLPAELSGLVPKDFLERVPFERLPELWRYLKGLRTRCDKASLNPIKDQERSKQVAPYADALRQLQSNKSDSEEFCARLEEFRWMVEEFKVSLFAQELGTAIPVSAKRLDEQLRKVREAASKG